MRAALVLAALAACKGKTSSAPAPDASSTPVAVTPVDAGPPPRVVALLDAFDREPDAIKRTDLAREIGNEDAVVGGVQDRVIALVRAYEAIPDGDYTASSLMLALIHQPPSRPVGDLALELARGGGDHTRFVAFHLMPKLTDRLPEVCAAISELAPMPRAVDTFAQLGDACVPDLAPVIDAIVRAAEHDRFEVELFMAALVLAQHTPLTPTQRDRLSRAAKLARKHADHHEAPFADALLRELRRR